MSAVHKREYGGVEKVRLTKMCEVLTFQPKVLSRSTVFRGLASSLNF